MIRILLACLILTGCSLFVSDEYFSKKIAHINMGVPNNFTTKVMLREGWNELFFYVSNYDCKSPLSGNIVISISVEDQGSTNELNLSELIWPKIGNELKCIPIGFVSEKSGRSFGFLLNKNQEVIFNFKNNSVYNGVNIDVWSAFNARLSLERAMKFQE